MKRHAPGSSAEPTFWRRPLPVMAGLVCLLVALSACGTRLSTAGNSASLGLGSGQPGSAPALGGGPGGAGGAAVPGSVGPAASGAAGVTGTGASAAGVNGTGAGSGAGATAAGSGSALGVTASTISIGYPYSTSAPFAAFSGACSACSSIGNETYFPQMFNVLAEDLNSRGGILGHKVAFQGYAYNSSSTAGDSSQLAQFEQAACQKFTHDTPVFAVVFESLNPEVLAPCLTKNGVSLIAPGVMEDAKDLNSLLMYAPGAGIDYPYMRVFLQRLAAQGYFSGWDTTTGAAGPAPTKLGVVNFNDPGWVGQGTAILQALKDLGYHVDPSDIISYSSELDTQSQSVQNAVLKFHSDGVTHVLGSGVNGLWMYEAVGQKYYPRYGWYVGFNSDTVANSQDGLRGSMGVGSFPVADMDPAQHPPSVGPEQQRCEKLATKAGIGWQSSQDIHAETLSLCDSVWSLAAALTKSHTLTPAGLAQGYSGLGTFPSAITFHESWNPGRHASSAVVEDIRYDSGCSCFRYTGVKTSY